MMLRGTTDALTFDDVVLKPAYADFLPADVSLQSRSSRHIPLNIPLLSAAMDTVTTSKLAIALAQEGGLGVVHRNMSIKDQVAEIRAVKKFETGVISDPITISSKATVAELIDLTRKHNISGVPVVDGHELVGIVTSRDIRFETNLELHVSDVMTARSKLITAKPDESIEDITELLHQHRIEKVLLVNPEGRLAGLVTVKDLQKASDYPNACKDGNSQLRVGAAVGTNEETSERVRALVEAGTDVVVVDTAHGHTKSVLDTIRWIKQSFPGVDVVGGNIATASGAKALVDAGADAIKVGMGPGSICTTRMVAGIGVPQVTAISEAAEAVQDDDVAVIADGGIRYSGDIAKAIAAGADSVMIGSLFAGTDEAPGELELFQGRSYKSYRGMGSQGAMLEHSNARNRYLQSDVDELEKLVPEGIEGRVPYRGPVAQVIHQLTGGLRAAMGYTGCVDIETMRRAPEFLSVTAASLTESHVHDVVITKEAPNYPGS